ncbi:MAG: Polyphosphate:AMP/ADP phosphotransferase [bacterium]|nr:Polyphosphate:AMP/ADP phosphotransferase [bacterium]
MKHHPALQPVTHKTRLAAISPAETYGMQREEAEARYLELQTRLRELQERFYASSTNSLLLILQGMDTSGKDGTIKKVVDAVDPQGVRLANFKAPTSEELSRDFLWRIHKEVPAKGQIGIFNRSHYEDVLIVRVRGFVPHAVWEKRYDHINAFESHLVASGTIIIKVMLHISKGEQKERLAARLADSQKRWKFNPGDLSEREHWDDYQEAYEAVLQRCSTEHAPWYVIPADRKWYRNWAVTQLLVDRLEELNPQYPQPAFGPIIIPD